MNVANILSSATGGGFKSLINSLDELMKKGLSPLVVLPMENEIHTLLPSRGIPTIIVKYRYNTYPPCTTMKDKLLFIPRLIARVAVNYYAVCIISKMLSDKNVDIIHTNVSIIGIGHYIAQKLHIPHIYHVREYGDLDFGYKYFPTRKHFIKQLSDNYSIFITKDIQKYFLQDQNSKSSVIYNGIQEKESKLPEKTNNDFFLYLGDVLPAKGTDILVKAYSKYLGMTKKPLPLYIVGRIANNSYAEEIHRYIRKCNMENKVFFLPKQSVSLVYMGCRASFYMLTLIVVPFVVNVDYVLAMWLERVPEHTSLFLYFIRGVALIYSLSQPITVAIQATGDIKAFQIWIFSLMVLEVCLTYLVLWITGSLVYALVPSVVVNFISTAVRMALVKKKVSAYSFRQYAFDVVLRCVMVLLVSCIVATYIHYVIGYVSFVAFLGECVVLAVSTTSIILLFGLKRDERLQLVSKLTMSVKRLNDRRV